MSDFHLLLEEEIPKLMRYATALTRDADEAGELVEDTLHEALATQQALCRAENLRVRLLTILHDLRDNPFRQPADPLSTPSRARRGELTLSQLDHALGELPETQRAIILLIGLEGLSYAETAAVLRMSLGAMRSQLSRGRIVLRRLMGIADAPHTTTRVAA